MLAVLMLQSMCVCAGPQEDAIAREVAAKSAEAYAKERVAGYLNRNVASTLPAGSGTSVFATIDLGSAVYDFSRAENDKQKAYAGSRAAIAGYALLGGPAAPVLAAALLVASVLESGMAARHQAEMLKIYKAIQDNYTRVVEIETLRLQSEWIQFRYLVATSVGALAEYETYIAAYSRNCVTEQGIADLAGLDGCVIALARALSAARLFVDTTSEIEDWRKRESQLIAQLEKAAEFDLAEITSAKAQAKKIVSDIGPRADEIYIAFAKYAADVTVAGNLTRPVFSTGEWVQLNCIDQAIGHARSGTTLLLTWRSLPAPMRKTQLLAYRRGVAAYRDSMCVRLQAMEGPYRLPLDMWNETVTTTLAYVSQLAR